MSDLPEPALNLPHGRYEGLCKTSTPSVPFFSATQMREYRNAALEEAIEHFNISSELWEAWEVAAFLKGLVK